MITTNPFLFWRLALALLIGLPAVAAGDCGTGVIPVSRIQGTGDHSSFAGQTVSVEGIITMDARQRGGFRGFYLQQADGETDNDPQSSEALFVYTHRTDGQHGDRVHVSGRVKEFHGLTELTDITSITRCGNGRLPEPVSVTLPWQDGEPPEHLENMRINVAGELTVINHYNLARYGELTLAAKPQTMATEILEPGPGAQSRHRWQAINRLLLDDGLGARNPRPIPWPGPQLSANNTVRTGDKVSGLTGIVDFRFGAWRLQPQSTPAFSPANPRAPAPERPESATLRVVTLNLGNFFNGDGRGGGFPAARGARSATQFEQQKARLVAALTAPNPDIIAVTEMENDGYDGDSAIAELAGALGSHWRYVETSDNTGNDAIRTDLLYRSDRVVAEGSPSRLTTTPFDRRGRPPVTQVFRLIHSDRALRVVVPHLKSKACRGASGQNRDQDDGQGCYNHSREQATRAIIRWTNALPHPDGLSGTLITGDMNAYARETPLQLLEAAGFINAVRHIHGCTDTTCKHTSYSYHGRSGTLDYSLVSKRLLPRIVDARTWSINSDEPRALGYKGPVTVPTGQPWRSSDHNPVITDLSL